MTYHTVYRFETPTGKGPYDGIVEHGFDPKQRYDTQRWPGPYEGDPPIARVWHKMGWREQSQYYFGFSSWRQALKWFGPTTIRKMKEHGIYCYKYRVPAKAVVHGEKQAIFVKALAQRMAA